MNAISQGMRRISLIAVSSTLGWSISAYGQGPARLGQVLIEGATPQTMKALEQVNTQTGARALTKIGSVNKSMVVGVPEAKISEWRKAVENVERENANSLDIQKLPGDYRSLLHQPTTISNLSKKQADLLQRQRKIYGAENIVVFKIAPPSLSNKAMSVGFDQVDGFAKPGSFLLPLEIGKTVSVEPEAVSAIGENGVLWKGHVQTNSAADSQDSEATIINDGGNLTGNVRIGRDFYSIAPIGEGLHSITKRDPDKLPKEHPPNSSDVKEGGNFDEVPTDPLGLNESASIDILFAFSNQAREQASNYKTLPLLVIDELRSTFGESKIQGVAVNFSGVFDLNYNEAPAWNEHWLSMSNKKHKGFTQLFKERDAKKADIVLIVLADNSWCGEVKGSLPVTQDRAVALVSLRCLTGPNYSGVHEIGHMLGARHDRGTDSSDRPFKWGHGYISPDYKWRTVMAYDNCGRCPRILRWSNPNVQYNGYPTGTEEYEFDAKAWVMRAKMTGKFR